MTTSTHSPSLVDALGQVHAPAPDARIICLLRDGKAAGDLARWLTERGWGASAFWTLAALGGPHESVREHRAGSYASAVMGKLVAVALEAKGRVTFAAIARVLLRHHRRRTLLGLSLMIAQAFAYNGVFFTYALVLAKLYGVPPGRIGLYLIPFGLGNLAGPILLGSLFAWRWRRWNESALLAGALVLEVSVFIVSSFVVGRDRPPVRPLDSVPPTSSYPSGHTAAAVAFYGALAIIVWWHVRKPAIRALVMTIAVVMPFVVGLSRMYRGMHHLSDVVVGMIIGGVSLFVTYRVVRPVAAPDGVADRDRSQNDAVRTAA